MLSLMPRTDIGMFWATAVVASLLYDSTAVPIGSSLVQTGLLKRSSVSSALTKDECSFDHSGFDEVLRKFVKGPHKKHGIKSTLFDYEEILESESSLSKLRDYVTSLESAKTSCLTSDGKLAFWANAYNALILHLVLSDVLDNGGQLPDSIQELKGSATSVWNRKAGIVSGKEMTLEEVLTEARALGDPRIHAAVNCASLSCPDLQPHAYSGEDINAQLDNQVKQWLNNPTKGSKMGSDGLRLSPIFEWHAEDFPDIPSFIAGPLGLSSSSIKVVGYLTYNWELSAA